MTSPYPGGPAPQPGGQPPAAPPPSGPPQSVKIAFGLFLAAVVLYLAGFAFNLVTQKAQFDAALRSTGANPASIPADQRAGIEATAATTLIVSLIVVLVLGAIFLVFVFLMRAGKNWARIVTTVLAAIFIAVTLFGSVIGLVVASRVGALALVTPLVSMVALILSIAGIVFMFRRDANAYFSPQSSPYYGAPR